MRRVLRKKFAGVSIFYRDGNYSNNLSGTDFSIDQDEGQIIFEIDLSGNLRVRNKDVNCYSDAHDLSEHYSKLDYLEVDEKQIIDGLAKAHNRDPEASWKLKINLGEKGSFELPVTPKSTNGGGIIFVNNAT